MKNIRLGDILLKIDLITPEQLDQALAIQKGSGKRLGEILIEHHFITEMQLIEALEMQLGIEFVDLNNVTIPSQMTQVLSKNIAKKNRVVPVRVERDTLFLATSDPLNFMGIEEVKKATRMRVVPVIATVEAIDRAIVTLYGNEGAFKAIEEMKREAHEADDDAPEVTAVDDETQSAPTVRLVNSIIERAVVERASDIHLEPGDDEMNVRMRIDGLMRNILSVPKEFQSSVISRLKVMGGMYISEKRIPQDGRVNITNKNRDIDLRISTLPTIHGEKIVIRLLDKNTQLLDKTAIGITGADAEKYDELMNTQSGVVLIAGPTGSGKSSTMYTMIRSLNTEQVNLITLEDPVEYQIKGINQVQINEKTGMTFANGLRSILRQDPDIIAVGEIRDGEIAEIAMRAAITGHLVLSTIHTNNAVAVIDRLHDIGIAPYLISGALRGIIAQRLVRKICPHCKESYTPDENEIRRLRLPTDRQYTFYRGKGCPMCFNTGYHGRTAIVEILNITPAMRRIIADRGSQSELMNAIRESGFVSIETNSKRLVIEGTTTSEEAIRTIASAVL